MEPSRDDFVIAIRSAFLKKGTKQRFSLLGLIFFSVLFLILGSLNFKIIDKIKITIKEVVYRSSFIVSGPENFIKYSFKQVQNHYSHYDEYQKLKNALDDLKLKDLSKKIITLENIRLKKLIDDYFITDNEVFAKVLIDKNSPFLRSIVINKGSKDKIKLGMVVLDKINLVGKIIEVNYSTSRVLLLSDINSKIPVSLQPGQVQAIMSGTGKQKGILQYTKKDFLKENNEDIFVFTSGAGGLFKSGISIGKIDNEDLQADDEIGVNFYVDFSQLKYVKVLSFSKEKSVLREDNLEEFKQLENMTTKVANKEETLRILLEQKEIADEVRDKIEEENDSLRNQTIKLQKEVLETKKLLKKNRYNAEDIKFLEMNLLYSHKCRKSFLKSKLYEVKSPKYRACILNKGKVKRN